MSTFSTIITPASVEGGTQLRRQCVELTERSVPLTLLSMLSLSMSGYLCRHYPEHTIISFRNPVVLQKTGAGLMPAQTDPTVIERNSPRARTKENIAAILNG